MVRARPRAESTPEFEEAMETVTAEGEPWRPSYEALEDVAAVLLEHLVALRERIRTKPQLAHLNLDARTQALVGAARDVTAALQFEVEGFAGAYDAMALLADDVIARLERLRSAAAVAARAARPADDPITTRTEAAVLGATLFGLLALLSAEPHGDPFA